MEILINKMAEAIYKAHNKYKTCVQLEPAKAALAAIQEDYVLVRKDKPVKYEYFCDPSYYHLWCVKNTINKKFGDSFHVQSEDEAKALCELLNKKDIVS